MSLQAEHAASQNRFADVDADMWGIRRALSLALEPTTPHLELMDVTLTPPTWVAEADDGCSWQWAALLSVAFEGGGPSAPRPVEVRVPWLIDDAAAESPPRGVVLGGHVGTYVGRPRIPVATLVRTPGVRLLARRIGGRIRVELELQPMFGAAWRVAATATRLVPRSDLAPLDPEKTRRSREPDLGPDGAAGLAARVMANGFHIDAATLDETIAVATGREREAIGDQLAESDVAALLAALRRSTDRLRRDPDTVPAGVVGELDPTARHLSFCGDQLLAAAYRSARAAVRAATPRVAGSRGRSRAARSIPQLLAGRLTSALAEVATGGTASVAADRLGNTAALAEAERQVSLLGPDGLPPLRGRLDLRTLDEQWRGALCPVHTPESTKVGFVRHAALGRYPLGPWGRTTPAPAPQAANATEEYADVSLAAALVPYLNHDDPTRASIVTKMFGQALRTDGSQAPAVRTGIEVAAAEAAGLVRAPGPGVVRHLGAGRVLVGRQVVRFGPAGTAGRDQDPAWPVLVPDGAFVAGGTPLAHAPDVIVEADGTACLRLGLDALTAFLPWHGWNYEDGIVVSSAFAERAASHHLRTVTVPLPPYADVEETVLADRHGEVLPAGTALAVVLPLGSGAGRPVVVDEDCAVVPGGDDVWAYTRVQDDVLTINVRVRRPLQVGDKLTTRHGGKGVVTRIELVDAMPRLPDGTPVEVLLNPLGVLRRLNVGTYLEAATALERRLSARTEPVVVPRRLGPDGLAALAQGLARLGAEGGRLPLEAADGSPVGPPEGVVVGDLHLMKLVHRAEAKAAGRKDAGPSPVSLQPSRSRAGHQGAPQRLGEMELWALQAVGARETLVDLLRVRGTGRRELRGLDIVPAGLRAAMAHLAVAGIHVTATTEHGTVPLWRRPGTPAHAITRVTVEAGAGELQNVWELEPTAGAKPRASARRTAEAILALALAPVTELDRDGHAGLRPEAARALVDETVRFAIPLCGAPDGGERGLPQPVQHPWGFRTGKDDTRLCPPMLTEIAILPAAFFLPPAQADHDPLRRRYVDLLTSLAMLRRGNDQMEPAKRRQQIVERVQSLLGQVGDGPAKGTIAGRLSGKYGILRRNLLGSSAIGSGRGALVGDPTLGVEQVGLPGWLLDDLGVPPHPTEYADVVVLNRQPTLHPYNLVALRAVPSPHDAVAIHPYLLQAIAGDFDGDTAAVHRPAGEEARAEIWGLCRPAATLHHARDGKPLAKRDLDVAVGVHVLEDEDPAGLEAAVGRPMPDGKDVATRLTALVEDLLTGDGLVEERLERVAEVMRTGWAGAHRWGFSVLDLRTLTPADHETPEQAVQRALSEAQSGPLVRLRQAFAAGAAGSATDLAQLLVARGHVRPNTALPSPTATTTLPECYLEGLSTAGYFAAAQPAIAGLAAKKLVTPHAGGLTKRLVELGYDAVLGVDDCGWVAPADAQAERSPLTCQCPDPCRACYDPQHETRLVLRDRARVGVLAGMLVGERSTQLAMKSIHQRGSGGDLKGDVRHLEQVFGHRALVDPDGGRRPWTLEGAADRFVELLPPVLPVHAAVLLRRTALNADGAAPRRPLIDAARTGELAPLIVAVAPDGPGPAPEALVGSEMLRLVLGVPR